MLLALAGCGACSGDPSGPGGEPDGPTGRIFFEWIPPGASRPQPWVYDFAAGEASRVPIWYNEATQPHVDTAGSTIVLNVLGFDLATVGLQDTNVIEVWDDLMFDRRYPRLSQDGRYIALTRTVPGAGEVIDRFDRGTREHLELAHFEEPSRVVHWFAGGDSLLVGLFAGDGTTHYSVVQLDSGASPFTFAPAQGAQSLAITNDGSRIALCASPPPGRPMEERDTRRVEVYDLVRRARIREFILPHWCGEMAWDPDGQHLVHAPAVIPGRESVLETLDVSTGLRTTVIPRTSEALSASFLSWAREPL